MDRGNSCTYSHGVLVGRICYKLIFSFMSSLRCDVRVDSKGWWHLRAYILEIWLRKPVKCPFLLCALCWVAIVLLQCQIMVLSTSWWFIDVDLVFFFLWAKESICLKLHKNGGIRNYYICNSQSFLQLALICTQFFIHLKCCVDCLIYEKKL